MLIKNIIIFCFVFFISIQVYSQVQNEKKYNSSIGVNVFNIKENRLHEDYITQKYYSQVPSGISFKLLGKNTNYRFSIQYFKYDFETTAITSQSSFGFENNGFKEINYVKGTFQELIPSFGIEKPINISDKLKLNIGFDFAIGSIIDTFFLKQELLKDDIIVQAATTTLNVKEKIYTLGIIPLIGLSYRIGNRIHITYESSIFARINTFGSQFFPVSIIDSLISHYDPISFLGIYYDFNFN